MSSDVWNRASGPADLSSKRCPWGVYLTLRAQASGSPHSGRRGCPGTAVSAGGKPPRSRPTPSTIRAKRTSLRPVIRSESRAVAPGCSAGSSLRSPGHSGRTTGGAVEHAVTMCSYRRVPYWSRVSQGRLRPTLPTATTSSSFSSTPSGPADLNSNPRPCGVYLTRRPHGSVPLASGPPSTGGSAGGKLPDVRPRLSRRITWPHRIRWASPTES